MMIRFACYNLRDDAELVAFAAFEERVAEPYAKGCRTFGWHSLGTYWLERVDGVDWGWTHADVYAVEGIHPEGALERAAAAVDPPGWAEIIEECRSYMKPEDPRGDVWLLPEALTDKAALPVPLGQRRIVLDLSSDSSTRETNPSIVNLGCFRFQGLVGRDSGHVLIAEPGTDPARQAALIFAPVTSGVEEIPALAT